MIRGNCYWILFILMYTDRSNIINGLYVDTCYTSSSCGSETIACAAGTVIAPEINYLFRKATQNTCPGTAADCDHVCCTFDAADGDVETNYDIPETNDILNYVVPCLKQESCNVQSPFDNTQDYDYVFFPYSCLEASKIVEIVDNAATETFNGDASVFYSGATEATPGTNCSCQVTSTSQMTITSIYVYLNQITCPKVKLTTDGGVNIVSCDTSGYLSLEDDYGPGSQFYLELNNLNATDFNVFWIKFETDPAADINIQCNGCSRSTTAPVAAVPSVAAGCYTDSATCSTVDLACTTDNVIAPSLYYLVKKQTPNACPAPSGDCGNTCCTFDEADFADPNNYEFADTGDTLSYVNECIKKESCTVQSTYNASLSFDYNAFSYYCIPVTSIVNMVDNIATSTFNGEVSIYYSAAEEATPGNNCSCVVTSATSLTIKSYYAYFDSTTCPKVIAKVSGTDLYTCDVDGYLSFEEDFGTTNQLYIELQNLNAAPDNVIWLSASTDPVDDISVSCSGCSRMSTTSPTTTSSTSTATPTTTTQTSTTTPTTATTTPITTTPIPTSSTTTPTPTPTTATTHTETTTITTTNPTPTTTPTTATTSTTHTGTTSITSSTNAAPTSSQGTETSNTTTGAVNSTTTNTTNLPNSGVDTETEATASSTGLIIGISAGVLVLGFTATHGVMYLIHKNKNAKVSP